MPKRYDKEHFANNLPDAFRKQPESNNYKLLELERQESIALREGLMGLSEALDLNKAKGKTLDYYGEMLEQARGQATDTQYRYMLRAKIMRNLSSGDYPSIVRAIAMTFGCDSSQVNIIEREEPCGVEIVVLPLQVIIHAGFTVGQTVAMIEKLLPVGVSLQAILLEGTFAFGDTYELDEKAGLGNEEQTTGGYFGVLAGMDEVPDLPI